MGKSKNRELAFARIKYGAQNATEVVAGLKASPHKTHRKVSVFLEAQLQEMSKAMIEQLKGQKESLEFAENVMGTGNGESNLSLPAERKIILSAG